MSKKTNYCNQFMEIFISAINDEKCPAYLKSFSEKEQYETNNN